METVAALQRRLLLVAYSLVAPKVAAREIRYMERGKHLREFPELRVHRLTTVPTEAAIQVYLDAVSITATSLSTTGPLPGVV